MATSTQIHDALAEVLDGVGGLRGFATPPEGANPPFAFPVLTGWEPDTFGRAGVRRVNIDVYVMTSKSARPQDGYKALLEFIDWSGASSVYLAIWDANDQGAGTFNGLADTQIASVAYRQIEVAEMDALNGYGGVFEVHCYTKEA